MINVTIVAHILPLFWYKAMTLLSNSHDALPQIYLVTDGSVDDERNICHTVKTQLVNRGPKSPRVSTFGLGNISYYFWLCITQLVRLSYTGKSLFVFLSRE